jgi:triphosphatase
LGYANDVRVASELWAVLPGSGNPASLDRAAGIVLGWHARTLADHEQALLKRLRKLRRMHPFW